MKRRKKRIIVILLIILIGLPLLFGLSMQIKAVQTKVIGGILKSYASKIGGKIELDGIYFSPISGINIQDLYIEDDKQDSLLYAKELSVSIADIDFKNSRFYLNQVVLKDAFYNLYSINEGEQTNMQFIIDYFAPEKKDTTKGLFFLRANDVTIENLRFKYKNFKPDSIEYGVNMGDIEISRFDLEAKNFQIINDSMHVDLKKIAISEKSGFELEDLDGHAIISNSEISVKNLVAKTPNSHIFSELYSMRYQRWKDLGLFTKKVKLEADIQLSSVSLDDIAFFAPQLKNSGLSVYSKGKVYGRLNQLKSNQFFISAGEETQIETKFRIQGLPYLDETFVSFDIKKMHLNFSDLENFLYKRDSLNFQPLPDVINKLKEINYKGNITGFLTDMVAYGTFRNSEGILETDLRYKYNFDNNSSLFIGEVATQDLSLSALNIEDTIFNKISMTSRIESHIDSSYNIIGDLKGNISSIGINNYEYKNINFEANLNQEILNSTIDVLDTNINMHLISKIDFSGPEIFFDLNCDLDKALLSKINLSSPQRNSELSFNLDAKFANIDIDDFKGDFKLNKVNYSDKDIYLNTENFELNSTKKKKKRIIDIQSDILSAHLEGEFLSKYLIEYFWKIKNQHLKSIETYKNDKKLPPQNIEFDFTFKKAHAILEALYPDAVFADYTRLSGDFDSKNEELNILFTSDSCRSNNILGEKVYLSLNSNHKKIDSDLNINSVKLSNDIDLKQFNIQNRLHSDSLNTYISWYDKSNQNQLGEILSETFFHPSTPDSICCDINFIPSYLYIEDSIWYINDAQIKIRDDQTSIKQFILNHDEQYLFADGYWQKKSNDSLNISLNQIDLKYFPIIEETTGLDIQGVIDGEIALGFVDEERWINGFIKADTIRVNKKLLGNLTFNAGWQAKSKTIQLKLINTIGRKKLQTIIANGAINIASSNLVADIKLNKQKLEFFQPFLTPYLSHTKGYVSGDTRIYGPLDSLKYNGNLNFQKTATTVDYLGIRYNFSDDVSFDNERINIDNIKIFQADGLGDYALGKGYITHHHFRDFKFFVNAEMRNFMVLNTNQRDNELFYGIGFLSGLAELSGTDQNIVIKVSGRTEKNTKFYIPLSESEEASHSNFISFTNSGSNTIAEEKYEADLSGIVLDFDLKATPDAEVQLIFDQQLGDIVKAKGNGIINLDINTLGDFSISGDYTIEEGEYLFTLQNVLNKKFKIEKGGNIKWNGDPYQAYIDIDAIYRLKTPLFDLTLDPEDKERIPVECHLNMKNSLTSPDIKFDVKLPSSGDKARALISAMDEDEKNKQVLSLLVLNSFYTPDYLRGGEEIGSGNAVGKNASELLSNQLSNWLSSVSDDFDIGVNYRPGDEISNDELELALSTQLFNDRVAIDGNVGVGKYDNTNSNVIGTVNVDVKINKKGNLRIRGFNRANDNEFESTSLYTQGVGLYYREDFDTFGELLNKYWKKMSFQTDDKDKEKRDKDKKDKKD